MPITDKIVTPIEISADPTVAKAIADIKRRVEEELSKVSIRSTAGDFPKGRLAVTAREEFEVGGKKFELRGRSTTKFPPSLVASEAGEMDVRLYSEFQAHIRELRQKATQGISEDVKRLRQFKESIRFQPLEFKIDAIRDFVDQFGDVNDELKFRLNQYSRQLNRREFREIQQRARVLRPEDAIRAYQEYIKSGGELIEDANFQIRQLVEKFKRSIQSSKSSKLRTAQQEINLRPLEERAQAWEDFLKDNKKFELQVNTQIARINEQLRRKTFTQARREIGLLPLEDREKAWRDFIQQNQNLMKEADFEIRRITTQLRSRAFSQARTRIQNLPIEEREKAWNDFLQQNQQFANQVQSELRKTHSQAGRQKFQTAKFDIGQFPKLEDQIDAWQDFANNNKELADHARREMNRVRRQLSRKTFADFRIDITGLSTEEQIRRWEEFSKTNTEYVARANAEIRKLTNKFVKETQNLRRTRFVDWSKNLQNLDLSQQLTELDRYLGQTTARFRTEAEQMRQRVRRAITQQQAQQSQTRNRDFANQALVAAGIGLGALGAAGFPLLNVGFAAMSGGPIGAAVVGLSTAAGELSRALIDLKNNAVQSAKSLGFVSTGFKNAEADMEALRAFMGSGALRAERVGLERRFQALRDQGQTGMDFNARLQTFQTAAGNRMSTFWKEPWLDKETLLGPGAWIERYRQEYQAIITKTANPKEQMEDLQSAYKHMLAQSYRGTPGIETDPYQSWLRIQNAAMDPSRQEEARLRQRQLDIIKEQIEALQANTEALQGQSGTKPKPTQLLN